MSACLVWYISTACSQQTQGTGVGAWSDWVSGCVTGFQGVWWVSGCTISVSINCFVVYGCPFPFRSNAATVIIIVARYLRLKMYNNLL